MASLSVRRVCLLLGCAVIASSSGAQSSGTAGITIDDSLFQPIRLPEAMAFGYPPNETYLPRIIELIKQRQFDSLDTFFDGLEADVKRDVRHEVRFGDGFEAADRNDPALLQGLDAWVAARPRSAHARVARARYHFSAAWRRRGTAPAEDTPPEKLRGMRESAAKGVQDVVAGLRADTAHLIAYEIGVGVMQLADMPDAALQMMMRGLSVHRGSYTIPRSLILMLWPRWGGSEDRMMQLAERVTRDSALNPRLITLRGAVYEARANDSSLAGNLAGAVRELNKALAYGPEPHYIADRGKLYYRLGAYQYAFNDLRAVMMERSQDKEVLDYYGRTLVELAARARAEIRPTILARAVEVLNLAVYLDPANSRAGAALTRAKEMAGK